MPLIIPDVTILAAALLAFILGLAFYLTIQLVLLLPLSQLPVIGSTVANGLDAAANAVFDTVTGWCEASWGLVTDTLFVIGRLEWQLWDMAAGAAEDATSAIEHLIFHTIPVAANNASSEAEAYADGARALAENYAQVLADGAAQSLRAAESELRTETNNVVSLLVGSINVTANEIRGEVRDLESRAVGLINEAEHVLTGAVGEAEATARAGIAAVEREALSGIAALWGQTQGLVTDVENRVEHDVIARDAAVAATAAVATAAVATTLENWLRDCGDPLCDGLSGLARGLPSLIELLETGALLAIVGAAIRDPKGMARVTFDAVSPVVEETAGFAKSLGGL